MAGARQTHFLPTMGLLPKGRTPTDTADRSYRTWAASYDRSAAEALRVPRNLKYCVGSDSSLLLYSHVPGNKSKAGTSVYEIRNKYPYYEISNAGIRAGATVWGAASTIVPAKTSTATTSRSLCVC